MNDNTSETRPDTATIPVEARLFGGAKDQPVPFALTLRARRVVAPEQLPDLRVVDPHADGALDRAGDPRPAQARALRRSGLPPEEIAARLGVDELIARAWVTDTRVTAPRGRRSVLASRPETNPVPSDHRRAGADGDAAGPVVNDEAELGRGLTRAAAHRDALERLEKDPRFAATVGLVAGMVEVERTGVSCVTSRQEAVARLLARLREELDLPAHLVRVVLRIAPGVAGDLARHSWAQALDLPLERMVHTRWPGAGAPDAVEAMLRIGDEDIAATIGGWTDAFFDPDAIALELAF